MDQTKKNTPAIWYTNGLGEPMDHTSDCYFCQVKTVGYNERTWHKMQYTFLKSAVVLTPQLCQAPIPVYRKLEEIYELPSPSLDAEVSSIEVSSKDPQRFRKEEIKDLVHDLNVSEKHQSCYHQDSERRTY